MKLLKNKDFPRKMPRICHSTDVNSLGKFYSCRVERPGQSTRVKLMEHFGKGHMCVVNPADVGLGGMITGLLDIKWTKK